MVEAMLRLLDISDLDNVMQWVNDPELMKNFADFATRKSREEEKRFLEKIIASENDKAFSIESETGEYIGSAGIYQIHWPSRHGRLAIILGNKSYHGQGYAQNTINKVLKLAFEQYNLHKVWLLVFEDNKKVRHIYEKCGFKVEGFLRDEYFHKGSYHTMVRMSILEKEYYEIQGGKK